MAKPNQLRLEENRALVSTFAGQDCTFGLEDEITPEERWKTAFTQHPDIQGKISFVPSFFIAPSTFGRFDGVMDSEFNWNSGWPVELHPQGLPQFHQLHSVNRCRGDTSSTCRGSEQLHQCHCNGYRAPRAIEKDSIYLWSRPHSGKAKATNDPLDHPLERFELTEDSVWAVVFTVAPAKVTLVTGDSDESQKSFDVPAGVSKLSIPIAPGGTMRGSIERDGEMMVEVAPTPEEFTFQRTMRTYNYNVLVVGKKADPRFGSHATLHTVAFYSAHLSELHTTVADSPSCQHISAKWRLERSTWR